MVEFFIFFTKIMVEFHWFGLDRKKNPTNLIGLKWIFKFIISMDILLPVYLLSSSN